MEYYLASARKEIMTCYNIDETWGHDAKKLARHKRTNTVYDSTYMKYLE